jgi:PAS domain S-box-containing protein
VELCAAIPGIVFFVSVEPDGVYRFAAVSRPFIEATGLSEERIIGKRIEDVIPAESHALVLAKYAEAIRTEKTVHWQETSTYPAGIRHGEVAVTPVLNASGNCTHLVGLVHDVTELRRSAAALREASQRKDEFLAVLSHELRNPLTAITTSLLVLERAMPGSEQARRAQSVIRRQVDQLTGLVNDLLDVARISSGKIQLAHQGIELSALVRSTVDDHRELFDQSEIRLELNLAPASVFVNGDPKRLSQIVANLLHNAVKFTDRGGHTTVTVSADEASERAVVRVADTGVGMSPQLLPRLFEPFMQADNTLARTKGGLGLGLALVKKLVELHGGDIDAYSAGPGQGAEFVLRLPLGRSETMRQPVERPARRSSRHRVIIIEDNVDAAESLREVCEFCEQQVEVAYDSREGIAKVRQFLPHLVLCDLGLPGMDGYEVARSLRADKSLSGMVLVALSGYAQLADQERAREAGFDLHLPKPLQLEKLEDLLAEVSRRLESASAG